MTIKEWLRQYRAALIMAERCFQELDKADVLIRSPEMTGMPRGNNERDLADVVAMRERIYKRAEEARRKALVLMDEIQEAIDKVPSMEHRTLLTLRYISCLRWDDIAVCMCYSVRQVHRMHGAALQMLAHNVTL